MKAKMHFDCWTSKDVTEIQLKFSNKPFSVAVTCVSGSDLSQQQWN